VFQLFQWWKTSKLTLVCPHCKEMPSPEAFRRGRYLVGGTSLRCEHCGVATPITLWRFEGLSQSPGVSVSRAGSRRSFLSEPRVS